MALQGGIDWKQEAQGREKAYFFLILVMMVVMFMRVLWGPKLADNKVVDQDFKNVMLQVNTLKARLADVKKQQADSVGHEVATPAVAQPVSDDRFSSYLKGEVRSRQEVMSEVVQKLTGPQVLKGLALNGHSVGTDVDSGTYLAVPLELNLEGPFAALVQYFDAVEKLPLLLAVDNLSVSGPPETPGRLLARLSISVYVVKSAAAITAGAVTGGTQGAPGTGQAPVSGGTK